MIQDHSSQLTFIVKIINTILRDGKKP